jgi:hypothetical protein
LLALPWLAEQAAVTFAKTRMGAPAIYDLNRIMSEPGFPTAAQVRGRCIVDCQVSVKIEGTPDELSGSFAA